MIAPMSQSVGSRPALSGADRIVMIDDRPYPRCARDDCDQAARGASATCHEHDQEQS